ncbi:hypothetical protein [Alkalicoccobacillus porphyridii]|uniref:hypothetical protein n=1 Tax=Alkalicoccobacillus porphyridii TaxID=2597270 RepID=UPI00163D53B1|nr:hypothetical protein [Alkalicoccobacillus porphyridii]
MIQINHMATGVIISVDDKEAGYIIPFGSSYIAKVNGVDELCHSLSKATKFICDQVKTS